MRRLRRSEGDWPKVAKATLYLHLVPRPRHQPPVFNEVRTLCTGHAVDTQSRLQYAYVRHGADPPDSRQKKFLFQMSVQNSRTKLLPPDKRNLFQMSVENSRTKLLPPLPTSKLLTAIYFHTPLPPVPKTNENCDPSPTQPKP